MSAARRLSICYLVPGHDLLSTVGPSRNVLNLAHALSEWADVTVAFRRVADDQTPSGLRVLEIQPGDPVARADDAAMSGIRVGDFLGFMRDLRRFAATELKAFDVVFEKSWLLSGYVSAICRRRGQLAIPVENIVVNPRHAARNSIAKLLRLKVAHWVAARAIRQAPLIIAETEFLKKEIAEHWGVEQNRIRVVDLGVDRSLFHPLEQGVARQKLGLAPDKTILVYVGVLDFTHNLEPVMRALAHRKGGAVELHVVGDGMRREEYRSMAAAVDAPAVFHGRVPHAEVPVYIAAADLCLAPYDAAAFSSGELGYSTMKIPEYLSVGRPVVSVPSGRIKLLVRDGQTGFLFPNLTENWGNFFGNLPTREHLRRMGIAAAATPLTSWQDTARNYFSICDEQSNRLKEEASTYGRL